LPCWLAFERRERQARPLQRCELRAVAPGLDRHDAGRRRAARVAHAQRDFRSVAGEHAGDDEPARRGALRLRHELACAERAQTGELAGAAQQRADRRLA
jgi:hypothetical protein